MTFEKPAVERKPVAEKPAEAEHLVLLEDYSCIFRIRVPDIHRMPDKDLLQVLSNIVCREVSRTFSDLLFWLLF